MRNVSCAWIVIAAFVTGCGATDVSDDGEQVAEPDPVGTPNVVEEPVPASDPTPSLGPNGVLFPFDPVVTQPPITTPDDGTTPGDGTGGDGTGGDGTGGDGTGGDGTGGDGTELPTPEPWTGSDYPTCVDLLGAAAQTISLPRGKNGTFKNADGVSITVVFTGKSSVDFKSSHPVKAVGVRGGPYTWVYPMPDGATGGTGLTTPSGNELEHVMFCYLPS